MKVWPEFGRNRPMWDEPAKSLPTLSKCRPMRGPKRHQMLADIWSMFGHVLVDFDQNRSMLAPSLLLHIGQCGPMFGPDWPMCSKTRGQHRPMLVEICQQVSNIDQMPTNFGRFVPSVGRNLINCWQSSSNIGRCGPNSGQFCPWMHPNTNCPILVLALLSDITEVRTYLVVTPRGVVPCGPKYPNCPRRG